MDTPTHIMIGVGLASLSQLDPTVAASPTMSMAVLIGCVIGSNAPDFDFVFKLLGRDYYRRNHRGWSHSIFALPIWAIIISSILFTFFLPPSYLHLFLWTLLAVIVHVLLDLFNVYGTQALKPFSPKWISFDSIPLTDWYIVALHAVGYCCLLIFDAGKVFAVVYLIITLYISLRTLYAWDIKSKLYDHYGKLAQIKLIPRAAFFKWDVLIETDNDFVFGVYKHGILAVEHTISKTKDSDELILKSRRDKVITNFLSTTNYAYPFVQERKKGYLILWKDLRFRKNKFFPSLAITYISSDKKSKTSYSGWFYSLKKYRKVIRNLEKGTGE
jgi:inner membrane protein